MKERLVFIALLLLLVALAHGHGPAVSAGSTLLSAPGARPAGMAEAFTAMQNDITAFSYNPSSLNSLKDKHAAFNYQKGLVDDAYGHLALGAPTKNGGMGLLVGYYNGGNLALSDGTTIRDVTAKSDFLVSVGAARPLGAFSLGIAGKYYSSTLAETESATAIMADLGAGYTMGERLSFGLSLQNIGTSLKYENTSEDLPRRLRTGMTAALLTGKVPLMMSLDVPYLLNEEEFEPSIGLESPLGPLSLRTGYRTGAGLNEFSVGAGFLMGSTSFDYAFGLAQELDSTHRVSLSMRFGQKTPPPLVKKPVEPQPEPVAEAEPAPAMEVVTATVTYKTVMPKAVQPAIKTPGAYLVKKGDTLEKIAQRVYGSSKYWTIIFDANEELITNPDIVELTGQRIWLPKKPTEAKQ